MANVLIGAPIYSDVGVLETPTFDASGDWEAGNPLANLQDRALWTIARSTSAAPEDTRLAINLGRDRAVRVVMVPKHNLSATAKWRVVGRPSTNLFSYVAGEDLAARGAVFARSGTATYVGRDGVLRTAADGVPRDDHWINGERTLLLEPERTNLCLRSEEFDTWTTQNGGAVTANTTTAPDGTLTMDLVAGDGTISSQGRVRAVTFTGNGTKCASIYLREGAGDTRIAMGIYDVTAGVFRHLVRVSWSAGIPSLQSWSGSGALYEVEPTANGTWRIGFSANDVVAANSNAFYVYTAGAEAAAGSFYAWGAQAEDAVVPSSYIKTEGTTVTRNADSLTWGSVAAGTRLDRYYAAGSATPTTLVAAHGTGAPAYTTGRAYTKTIIAAGTLVEADFADLVYDSGWLDAWPSGWDAEAALNLNLPLLHVLPSDYAARDWSLQFHDEDNPDGYLDLHRLCITGAYEPSVNFTTGAEVTHESDSTTRYADAGNAVHDERPLRRVSRFTIQNLDDAEAFGQAFRTMRKLGAKGQCVLVLRPDADADLLPETSFLAVPRELTRLEYPYAMYRNAAFAFTEEL